MDFDEELLSVLEEKQYKFVTQIGSGGSAIVYLVESLRYHQNFVCKQISLDIKGICKECELQALKNLGHPSIISLYDYKLTDNFLFLFLEYCPHGSLEDYVLYSGAVSQEQLLPLFKNILTSVEYIHSKRVAHSDIKPGNIFFDRYGRPKLADFGLSRLFQSSSPESDYRAGSLAFMSPEMFNNNRYDPFAADIWALGVTLYIISTGLSPFPLKSPQSTIQNIQAGAYCIPFDMSETIAGLIKKMMNPIPNKRPKAKDILNYPCLKDVDMKDGFIKSNEFESFSKARNKQKSVLSLSEKLPISNKLSSANKRKHALTCRPLAPSTFNEDAV